MATLLQNIEALNMHNAKTKEYYFSALEQMNAFIGKKVRTAKNERTRAFELVLPALKGEKNGSFLNIHAWVTFSGKSIWLYVKTCYNGGSFEDRTNFCVYVENELYLGETDESGVLTALATESTRKSWLDSLQIVTIEDVRRKEKEYKELKEKANEVYKAIPEHLRKVLYLER